MNDKDIIKSFVSHLSKTGQKDLKIDRFPDEENKKTHDIDAIAGKYAIEHTSIDTVENQRRDSAHFTQAIKELEEEFSTKLDYRLNITFPYDGVKLGQDWSKINSSIREWIKNTSPSAENGHYWVENITGIPFKFHVRKSADRNPGLFFARFEPDDNSLSDRLSSQLHRKIDKLRQYKKQGKETVLIVDSNDIALMHQWKMTEAIFTAFSKGFPEGLDQIWYADTTLPNNLIFENITDIVKDNIKNT